MRKRPSQRTHAGFTLIEIMVGMVLTGILVAGVVGLWGMVGEQFFRLSLRQKAVFVLHGNMERLAELYRSGSARATNPLSDTTGYPDTGGERSIFKKDSDAALVKVVKDDFVANGGAIFYLDNTDTSANRNLVWLDQERDVVAQLSWTVSADNDPNLKNSTNADCYLIACRIVTLYMDYPYRFNEGTPTEIPNIETITLKTIVGQWR